MCVQDTPVNDEFLQCGNMNVYKCLAPYPINLSILYINIMTCDGTAAVHGTLMQQTFTLIIKAEFNYLNTN